MDFLAEANRERLTLSCLLQCMTLGIHLLLITDEKPPLQVGKCIDVLCGYGCVGLSIAGILKGAVRASSSTVFTQNLASGYYRSNM